MHKVLNAFRLTVKAGPGWQFSIYKTLKRFCRLGEIGQEKNMKSSIQDKMEGTIHKVKGKVKETVGKVIRDRSLEIEGKAENFDGKVQENVGKLKKVIDK